METYTLKYPVTWDDKEVTDIEVRRPKGKHIKRVGATSDLGSMMNIAASITDYTPKFYDELDAVDYLGVAEVIGGFLDNGQEIG